MKAKGNIAAEYGIIGATVFVTAITGWQLLGESLQGQTLGMKNDMAHKVSRAEAVKQAIQQAKKTNQVPGSSKVIKLRNGQVITLDNYPDDLEKAVFTAGVNGATGQLADNLIDLVNQLKAANQISDAEASILLEMANKAHRMAQIESIIQSAMQAGSTEEMLKMQWQFDGQVYTTQELANMIGWGVDMTNQAFDASVNNNDRTSANIETVQFMDMMQTYKSLSQNADPAVQQAVDSISKDILRMAEAAEGNTYFFVDESIPAEKYNEYNGMAVGGYKDGATTASEQTHNDGGNTCNIGGGQDSGTQCSG